MQHKKINCVQVSEDWVKGHEVKKTSHTTHYHYLQYNYEHLVFSFAEQSK